MNRKIGIVSAVALAMVVGGLGPAMAGHGTWQAFSGQAEPNTKYDEAAWMWQAPNSAVDPVTGSPVDRIYFNGLVVSQGGLLAKYDAQIDGGSMLYASSEVRMIAALGFWRDCNGDGYIGSKFAPASYGSFGVYPRDATLTPLNTALCPLGSPYNPINTKTGQPNGMIDEFRWIGPLASYAPAPNPGANAIFPTTDAYDVNDANAKVWADWGYPGSVHVNQQGITVTHDNTKDSDATLKYVDIALQGQLSALPGWGLKPSVGACSSPPVFLGGPGGTCGLWVGHQGYRVVNDETTTSGPTPLVTAFETHTDDDSSGSACDDTDLAGRRMATISPSANPNILVQGSVVGTLAHTWQATNGTRFDGTCGPYAAPVGGSSNDAEGDVKHHQPSETFSFKPDQRFHALDGQGYQEIPLDVFGIKNGNGPAGLPAWEGDHGWTNRPPRAGWGALSAAAITFYADVSPLTFSSVPSANPASALPSGVQDAHTYGTDYCTTFTTGPSNVDPMNLWDCSITQWVFEQDLDKVPAEKRVYINDKYDLRDVDCYDNTISDVILGPGFRVGLADCSGIYK